MTISADYATSFSNRGYFLAGLDVRYLGKQSQVRFYTTRIVVDARQSPAFLDDPLPDMREITVKSVDEGRGHLSHNTSLQFLVRRR